MPILVGRFREMTPENSYSASTFTFSQREGASTLPVIVYGTDEASGVTTDDIREAARTLLGYTETGVLDGRINRHPPMVHPIFQAWTASAILRGQGVGQFYQEQTDSARYPDLERFEWWARYKYLLLDVEFKPRQYLILPNNSVVQNSVPYVDTTGSTHNPIHTLEWERYTRIQVQQIDSDFITAEQGDYKFVSSSDAGVNGTGFMGHPRMPLQNSTLIITWYEVPYRFVFNANSYLMRWRGRVNQTAWRGFPAGSLLYDGFVASDYCPPHPDFRLIPGFQQNDNPEVLCDITMKFVYTTRRITGTVGAPANANHVAAGHNLLPYFPTRNFYYATSASNVPSFLSFPMEMLFTDPDAPLGSLAITVP